MTGDQDVPVGVLPEDRSNSAQLILLRGGQLRRVGLEVDVLQRDRDPERVGPDAGPLDALVLELALDLADGALAVQGLGLHELSIRVSRELHLIPGSEGEDEVEVLLVGQLASARKIPPECLLGGAGHRAGYVFVVRGLAPVL